MKPSLRDAKVVAFRERGETLWRLATRERKGEPFRVQSSMSHVQPNDFYQDIYLGVVVVEEFPSVRSVVGCAPAFIGKDEASDVVRAWACREDGMWGAVNLNSARAYPATVYSLDSLDTIVDVDSIVVLREVG